MRRFSEKSTLLFFYGFDLLLVLLFVLIFFPLSKRNSPDMTEISFVPEDDAAEIFSAEICVPSENKRIIITKENGIWLGTDDDSNRTLFWPCDVQTAENFVSAARKKAVVTKKAEKVSAWKSLGVDEKSGCRVTFYFDGKKSASFWFGKTDSVSGKTAFRTSKNQTVWEAETPLADFVFETDASFWADPFLEPVCVAEKSFSESGNSLRRGKLVYVSPSENLKPDHVVSKIFPNGTKAVYSVYKKDDSFVVIPSFFSGENEIVKKINYRYSVSKWTLERFLEENDE